MCDDKENDCMIVCYNDSLRRIDFSEGSIHPKSSCYIKKSTYDHLSKLFPSDIFSFEKCLEIIKNLKNKVIEYPENVEQAIETISNKMITNIKNIENLSNLEKVIKLCAEMEILFELKVLTGGRRCFLEISPAWYDSISVRFRRNNFYYDELEEILEDAIIFLSKSFKNINSRYSQRNNNSILK